MRSTINNIAFDLGGVVLALSYENAIRRFEEIGLTDARQHLDAFHQHSIFGDLERGRIFRMMLEGQQATADETLFIDDSPNNCAAAQSLGIHTLCPQNNEDWIPSLKAYLS